MNKQIKQRIDQIKNGEVPQGYKKTKIGIVPNDWEEKHLKNYSVRITRKNTENNTNVLTISAQHGLINQNKFFNKEVASENKSNYYLIEKGEFAYNKSYSNGYPYGAIKKLNYYDKGILSPLYICFSIIPDNGCAEYFEQYFENGILNKEIKAFAQEGARNHGLLNISVDDFFNSYVVIPPLNEQQKISEILSTQDKVIELKEKLLKEKEKQKKYLMQILLTGRKRLKGFEGEWKKVKLKEYLMEISTRNKELKINNVLSVNNKLGFVKQEIQFGKTVASKDLSNYKIIKNNFIAYNPSRINVGSIAMYQGEVQGIVSPMYVVFKTSEMLDSNYFMFFVQSYEFFEKMKSLLSGSVRDSLNFSDLCNMQILLPSLEEQKAISEILTTADKELKLLQEELEEEKRKKKALMQLLLTGIVRVKQ